MQKVILSNTERQGIAIFVILGVIAFFYAGSVRKEIEKADAIEKNLAEYQESIRPFYDMALASQAFAIYDPETKNFLYKSHAEKVMPLASLAKVMSAIVIMEHTTPDQIFSITKEGLSETGDNGLLLNEKWKRDELLEFTLVASSNDAIHDMASTVGKIIYPGSLDPIATFVETMNKKAEALGLHSMVFSNVSGLDVTDHENGAYANARDMAKLFAYAIENYPEIFSATAYKEFLTHSLDAEHTAVNTNKDVEEMPGLLASKTGFTGISGGNLIVSVPNKNGHQMIVVVLGSTFSERFTDVMNISKVLSKPAE